MGLLALRRALSSGKGERTCLEMNRFLYASYRSIAFFGLDTSLSLRSNASSSSAWGGEDAGGKEDEGEKVSSTVPLPLSAARASGKMLEPRTDLVWVLCSVPSYPVIVRDEVLERVWVWPDGSHLRSGRRVSS